MLNINESSERPADIWELRCNMDDMTGEQMGFAMEMLMEQGALDVFSTPITMKKSRPGILLTVICNEADKEKMVRLIFKHTTTLGIRETFCNRYMLERHTETVNTPYGPIRKKVSSGYGIQRSKYEYEDIAKAARENNMSIAQILSEIE